MIDAGELIPLEYWKSLQHVLKRALDLRSKLESVPRAHYSSGEGCLEGTRQALLADVNTWVRGSSKEKLTWVQGHAGSGKSALLNSIAESFESAGIPFTCFPCKRDDPELSNIHRILATIAYNFTEYYGDYRGLVSDLVDQPAGRSVLTGDVKKQSELLFGKKYELIAPKGANRPTVHIILIDALDECRNHRDRGKTMDEHRALLRFLIELADKISWIKVLVTSRPDPDIVDTFAEATAAIRRIDINDDEWKTSGDIRLFVEAQSTKLKLGLSPDQISRFQEKAAGLFVWCATVFRYIEGSKRGKKDIVKHVLDSPSLSLGKESPFDSLYTLYHRVLDSAVGNLEDKLEMESILGVIFVASTRQPLSANAITDIMHPNEQGEGFEETKKWVNNVIESLSSIIYVEEGTNAVRTYHPSVLDFIGGALTGGIPATSLSSNTINPFSIKLEQAHARVFEGCFAVMDRDLRFNICELEDSSRLNIDVLDLPARITEHIAEALRYGCLFWLSHTEQYDAESSVKKVLAFLSSCNALFWVEALSLLGGIDRGVVILQDCSRFFTVRSFPQMLNNY